MSKTPVIQKDLEAYIKDNTFIASPPLCPEIQLHLLKDDAPMKETAPVWRGGPHLFDWEGPRPYWAFAWAGGQALARFILDNPGIVKGRKVIDFGAGSGICAIAAALSGASSVSATDLDPAAIKAIEMNAGLNGVDVTALQENIIENSNHDWDVFLAGDAFHNGQEHHWLLALAEEGKTILFGDPSCRGVPREHCEQLTCHNVMTYPMLEDWTAEAQVLRLKRA